jgi:hypothetical protein
MASQNVLIGFEFADALSGDFLPHSDPEYRLHRLARLARSATQKGTPLRGADAWPVLGESLRVRGGLIRPQAYEYKPSWSEATCVAVAEETVGQLCITGISLAKRSESTLSLFDLSDSAHSRLVYVQNGNQVDLPLDDDPNAVQREVARVAQVFFNEA